MKAIRKSSLGLLVVALLFGANAVHAQRLQFVPSTQSAVATTTLTFIPIGGSATTSAFDSFAQGQIAAIDQGTFLMQNVASSTSAVVTITTQYSQDGIDWYSDELALPVTATTTQAYNIGSPVSYIFTAASTATSSKAVRLNFPTRYIREVITAAGAQDGIWYQFIPQRQAAG